MSSIENEPRNGVYAILTTSNKGKPGLIASSLVYAVWELMRMSCKAPKQWFRRVPRLLSSTERYCSCLGEFDTEYQILAGGEHNVLIIQPIVQNADIRRGLDLNASIRERWFDRLPVSQLTKGPDVQEAVALVDSVGGWTVHDVIPVNLRTRGIGGSQFFTKGIWPSLTETVRKHLQPDQFLSGRALPSERPATVILVNWKQLQVEHLIDMQRIWKCPVLDRYTLVVHLFLVRSRTYEAKVQAKLAQLNLVRKRLSVTTAMVGSSLGSAAGCSSRARNTDHLQRVLDAQERHFLEVLRKETERRNLRRSQRRERTHNRFPVVAVVGYTNAGKTSLIKCLSGAQNLHASPRVFATLDITHHTARLPALLTDSGAPGLRLFLVDTIGFMADLPRELIAAFRATLTECHDADVIIHLIDASQPNWQLLAKYVECVLRDAEVVSRSLDEVNNQSENRTPVILRVGNKIDLVNMPPNSNVTKHKDEIKLDVEISSSTGLGISELCRLIEWNLLTTCGWTKRTLRIRQGSDALTWLYTNAMVTNITMCSEDSERLLCEVLFNPTSWSLFQASFLSRVWPSGTTSNTP